MANQVVDKLRVLQDAVRARAPEFEAAGRMPPDLVDELKAAGVFRTYVPKSHGGLEMDFPEGLDVIREAARIDGSLGWIVMIGSAGPIIFARLPRHVFDEIYRNPDAIQAGAAATPGGYAEEAEGGYITKGRWPFASGCQHADVILGNCAVTRGGEPVIGPGGMPVSKLMVLPASEFEIEATWDVAGLKGTGSHHTRLSERFVPAERFFAMTDPGQVEGPLYAVMGPWIPLMHCAFAVGLAEGAVEDLVEMATGGRKQLFARTRMQESPVFQYELGRVDADVAAARAMMQHVAERQWARAKAGRLGEPAAFVESLQAGVWVTEVCLKAAQECFTLGGGTALYASSPLQRRLRDMNGGAQHALVQRQNYQGLGAGRLGIVPGGH